MRTGEMTRRYWPWGVSLAMTAVSLSVAATLVFSRSERGPQILFEDTQYDFGRLYDDEGPVEHEYRFRNTGDAVLQIGHISRSCGCTEVTPSAQEFRPGQSGAIHLHMDIRGRMFTQIKESMDVETNDPRQPLCHLETTGILRHAAQVEPRTLHLGPLLPGAVERKKVTVRLEHCGDSYALCGLSSDVACLQITPCGPEETQPETYGYEISATGGREAGRQNGEILIRTSHPKAPVLRLPVSVEHAGRWSLTPKCLYLGRVGAGQTVDCSVTIGTLDGSPCHLSDVALTGPWRLVRREIIEAASGISTTLNLRLACADELPETFLKGELLLAIGPEAPNTVTLMIAALGKN